MKFLSKKVMFSVAISITASILGLIIGGVTSRLINFVATNEINIYRVLIWAFSVISGYLITRCIILIFSKKFTLNTYEILLTYLFSVLIIWSVVKEDVVYVTSLIFFITLFPVFVSTFKKLSNESELENYNRNMIETLLLNFAKRNSSLKESKGVDILFNGNKLVKKDNVSCIYGFGIVAKDEIISEIFHEAKIKNKLNNSLKTIEDWKKIKTLNFYPLYWGIDINAGSRLNSHLSDEKKYSGTGSIKLNSYNSLLTNDLKIYYGAVFVDIKVVDDLEEKIKIKYPDLLRSL